MGHQVGDVITGVKGQQEESTGIQEANVQIKISYTQQV